MSLALQLYHWLRPSNAAAREAAADAANRALRNDPRLRAIPWRDLVPLTRGQKLWELSLPLPWLAAELFFAHREHYAAALFCSVFFFITAFRLTHEAMHDSLRLGPRGAHAVLFASSIALFWSSHAARWTHLRHHRLGSGPGDIEATPTYLPGWRALLAGPLYTTLFNLFPLQHGDARTKRWVAGEWIAIALWSAAAFPLIDPWLDSTAFRYHVIAMALGEKMTSFFCAWTVHHHTENSAYPARTQNGRLANVASYNMFLHVEHHLFPRVPTRRLHILARRLDAAAPELRRAQALGMGQRP